MSVGGGDDIVDQVPKWESELWSYVSSGDGMHCPFYSRCRIKKRGGWCPDENKERLNKLLDEKQSNLYSCDYIESEVKGFCRIFQLVERLSQKYLKRAGVCCPPVPEGLATIFDEQHDIEVHQVPLKVHHGAIWRIRDRWVIQLKDSDAPATRRFSLFHEAFHILAHCRTTPVFRRRGAVGGSFNELLADAFAAYILMPRQWVKEKWVEVKDLDRMAQIFGVPKSAMCIRLRWLGLIY
ncbi:MAG: ImmA/IrrE family metallo-endopeptidase [Dehalococcoidia bacterium]|nr:ImmA/IrrE family metallo-endopeptidase [Dehalococcoidia bacterium]